MIQHPEMNALVEPFLAQYDAQTLDALWREHSQDFRQFWEFKVMAEALTEIPDETCDSAIAILDRNAKGNSRSKGSEAVARAMVPQGAWRRMFNELHANRQLGAAMNDVLMAEAPEDLARAIDALIDLNAGAKNYLTGASCNAIGAMLAAWRPFDTLSIISLKDRRAIIEHLGLPTSVG